MELGYTKGDICNRNGCKGIIDEYEKEGCCSCHINPPCGYCTTLNQYCEDCNWDANEEFNEDILNSIKDFQNSPSYQNYEHYEQRRQEEQLRKELFNNKFNGLIPATELELRYESHTHFSMIVKGVYPKGTETYESLRPKVNGTFGGRFTTPINEETYKFIFIAYTD